ncbi:MAG: hypothetical protein KA765_00315, partial [Thermoflexales bacterium]|nr:hypothetical protein [Thermoflexales bacterium]
MIINDFQVFYNAAVAWLSGASPYSVYGFWNPVWGVLPFLPLTLLPITVAQWVWVVATLLGAMLALARFKVPPVRVAAFVLLSPFCLLNFHFANVDWLVLLGATLPPQVGIWLVALKPQTGFVVIMGWTLRTWRKDGWRGVAKLLLPISIVVVIQLVTIGFGVPDAKATASNFSLLPWGIPFGVLMLIKYVREGETSDALISA